MMIKNKQTGYTIDFPEYYSDPRDFHDAVMRTSLESLPVSGSMQIVSIPVLPDMVGFWYVTLCLNLLVSLSYRRFAFVFVGLSYDSLESFPSGTIHHEFAPLVQTHLDGLPATPKHKSLLAGCNRNFGFPFSVLSCLTQSDYLTSIIFPHKIKKRNLIAFVQQLDEQLQGGCVCVFLYNNANEKETESAGNKFFDAFCEHKSIHKQIIGFTTDFGDMDICYA